MTQLTYGKTYGGTAPENYERYFVPSIGVPFAEDLIKRAALRPGERVLDVACGTGVVTRLAAQRVGETGAVAGLDVNAGMLAVARSATPAKLGIDWYEAGADAIPLPDGAYDVVLCQMGLQFIANKLGALREMRRVLAPGGRLLLNVPGPTPPMFAAMADALGKHIGPQATVFVHIVFSLHNEQELRELMDGAGFHEVNVQTSRTTLALPPAREFLWQYAFSTPLANAVAKASDESRAALEEEVASKWRNFSSDGTLRCDVPTTTVTGR